MVSIVVVLRQLSGHGSDSSRDEWQEVVREVRRTVTELETLQTTCVSLRGGWGRARGRGSEQGGLVRPEAEVCAQEIGPRVREVMAVEQTRSYLQWMGKIRQLRSVQ